MSFFAELKRRNVFRVAIAYVVLAWIVMQVGDTLAPALRLPETVNSVLAFFLILGFPLAMFFAWAFEITPDGLKLEKDVDRDTSIAPHTGRKLDRTIIVMLVVALGYFIWQSQTPTADPEVVVNNDQSIAVLPFENMSSDAEQEYFSDGLSEELLNLLAKIPELRVSSRTSAFSYKGKDFKISDVGRELNVAHVLEGSVRKSGNKVRITAQLIQTDTDVHLWSETWDRTLDDVFVIQDEIAEAVVAELKIRLLGDLPTAVAVDPEAYSLFLQARYGIDQRTDESLVRSEEQALQALQIDPTYVAAWVLLARIYGAQAGVGVRLPNVAYPLAREAIDKALQLEPDFGRARALLASHMVYHDWNFAGAKPEFEFALAADPGDFETIYQASIFESTTGNPEEGLRLGLLALERDPLRGGNYAVIAFSYEALGRHEEAVAISRKLAEIQPAANGTQYYLSNSLVLVGDPEQALTVIDDEILDGFRFTGQAIAQFAVGNKLESDKALAALLAVKEGGWDYQYAIVHAVRGETDEAIAALQAAYEKRDTGLSLILDDPFLENIRSDPRYEALVERLGIRLHD
jgi:adenylate cyclase